MMQAAVDVENVIEHVRHQADNSVCHCASIRDAIDKSVDSDRVPQGCDAGSG